MKKELAIRVRDGYHVSVAGKILQSGLQTRFVGGCTANILFGGFFAPFLQGGCVHITKHGVPQFGRVVWGAARLTGAYVRFAAHTTRPFRVLQNATGQSQNPA